METKWTKMSIREVQLATLEILKKVHNICEQLNINYYLMYGSLIGAVRHKGFIPWDDDLDIGMKRKDYEAFLKYTAENIESLKPLEIHNPSTNQNCFYNITRVCDTRYYLKFDMLRYTSGVFIDIYPLDGLGNDSDLDYWNNRFNKLSKWQKGLLFCSANNLTYGSSKFTQIANVPFCIFSKIIGRQHYINKLNDYRNYKWSDSKYVGVPSWEKTCHKREWYDEVILLPFEDIKVKVAAGYDSILRKSYGDYMQLPPEDQRIPHHGYCAYKPLEL